MKDNNKELNDFFVNCFYSILKNEENTMTDYADNLSISEVHLIEAISRTKDNNGTNVSKHLQITLGSLTVAASTLINKGYIIKKRDENDKRISRLYLTEKGKYINEKHNDYHNNMINGILENISDKECEALINALKKINKFMEKTK
jgi:DNA-binding MarR family transcriptional regulator